MCTTNKLLLDVQLRLWLVRQSLFGFCFELPIVLPQGHHGVGRRSTGEYYASQMACCGLCPWVSHITWTKPKFVAEIKLAILDYGLLRWKLLLCRVHDFTKPCFQRESIWRTPAGKESSLLQWQYADFCGAKIDALWVNALAQLAMPDRVRSMVYVFRLLTETKKLYIIG